MTEHEKIDVTIDDKHIESNSSLDYDAQKLQDLGYKQEFKREISLFAQIGFLFTSMAVLPNWMLGFGLSINAGGPSSLFWGWIVVSPFVCCIALSMAEVISAYPLEGGVFSWTLLLSNKKRGPLFWTGLGTIAILCTVPAMAPKYNSAKWVFTEFTNNTGYESVVMVFFVGMLQAGWSLSGYVCGAQIVEGTKRADVTAPRGIIICVTGVILQGLVIILITLFSIQDIDELIASKTPISTFFLRATNSPRLTAFFLIMLLFAQFGSLCNTILATSHFTFAFARDGCLPFSSYFSKLSEKTRAPERALIAQLIISILIIMPNFASEIYWQAIMSATIIAINIAYGMPFVCRLLWVRNDMPRGPFSLGRFGLVLNFISVVWISFFSVILCIPSVSPVTPETMNWASAMIGGVLMFSLLFWFISGRKNYEEKINSVEKQ
ncbi:hypothetical protein MFLAVUS_007170 [Mucor flavus]|uniref:Amino acid transporter n=1 Tax=Mucor flavus TaxID=439312 RepID=A0ABP9Z3K1_9FUNG